jgi:hypothetical protein
MTIRVPCSVSGCKATILPETAERTGGPCMQCFGKEAAAKRAADWREARLLHPEPDDAPPTAEPHLLEATYMPGFGDDRRRWTITVTTSGRLYQMVREWPREQRRVRVSSGAEVGVCVSRVIPFETELPLGIAEEVCRLLDEIPFEALQKPPYIIDDATEYFLTASQRPDAPSLRLPLDWWLHNEDHRHIPGAIPVLELWAILDDACPRKSGIAARWREAKGKRGRWE